MRTFPSLLAAAAGFLARLAKLNIPCEQQNVEGAGYQIFVRDPVGTTLEFNFRNGEAPESVASGTLAARA